MPIPAAPCERVACTDASHPDMGPDNPPMHTAARQLLELQNETVKAEISVEAYGDDRWVVYASLGGEQAGGITWADWDEYARQVQNAQRRALLLNQKEGRR